MILILDGCGAVNKIETKEDVTIETETNIIDDNVTETTESSSEIDKIETDDEMEIEIVIDTEMSDVVNQDCLESKTVYLINQIRTENGLNELTWDNNLYYYSSIRAQEASINWSHIRPNGTSWKEMNPDVYQGENLAKGYNTADDVVNAWMNSQGHKENILREGWTRISVSYYKNDVGDFWCCGFGY